MGGVQRRASVARRVVWVGLALSLSSGAFADVTVTGRVVDLNGRPMSQAMVRLTAADGNTGASVISVFTDQNGRFTFPDPVNAVQSLDVRVLGYEQLHPVDHVDAGKSGKADLTIVMRSSSNEAAVAPASAWLAGIKDRREKSRFVRNCIDCHQVPAREVRAYAKQIASVKGTDPAVVRRQSWTAIVHYMNYISRWEFGRATRTRPLNAEGAYAVTDGKDVIDTLTKHFVGPMDELSGYGYGAPLIVNGKTVIKEYRVKRPNAVREALLLGHPKQLWVADVSTNRMYEIDPRTGRQRHLTVPSETIMGPHSLHRGADGSLWATPLFNSVIAHLNPDTETWKTYGMTTINGVRIGVHDLSFGYQHELETDPQGRIWYSDIGDSAVGYLDPKTGKEQIFRIPPAPGRSKRTETYGLVMTRDRKHIWYSQLAVGVFGSFNVETEKFGTQVVLKDPHAGPRRLTIDDNDIMYVSLYGSGQLLVYDTKNDRRLGLYDLPDTGSAPYGATWDPVRRVVWIATSNGGVIYRFDPETKKFGVLPLPRGSSFLRMIDIDPQTGNLITSYGNVVQFVHGPRMALIIDPGDDAYKNRVARAGQ